MKTFRWKRSFNLALCGLGLATSLGCSPKTESTVDTSPPQSGLKATDDTRPAAAKASSDSKSPRTNDNNEEPGPLGVRPPDTTPPGLSRGGSGTGTPTGPGSALPGTTSGDGATTH